MKINSTGKYILVDKKPILEPDLLRWGNFMKKNKDRIVKQENIGNIKISTVFLGVDHSWNDHFPALFETMIFGGEHSEYQERYTTWDEALAGHETAKKMVAEKGGTK